MSRDNPKEFTWADVKTIAINNLAEDILLCMTVQTEQHGITKGVPIATGQFNLNKLYENKKEDGKAAAKIEVKMEL
jgi:hypothetical protein